MSDETYKVKVGCNNCDFDGEVNIPRGIKVHEMECPMCGCKDLEKISNFPIVGIGHEEF